MYSLNSLCLTVKQNPKEQQKRILAVYAPPQNTHTIHALHTKSVDRLVVRLFPNHHFELDFGVSFKQDASPSTKASHNLSFNTVNYH